MRIEIYWHIPGLKAEVKGLSFIDWEGLSEDEYQHLNRIINNPLACSGVKLPFCSDQRKFGPGEGQEPSTCNQSKQPQHNLPEEACSSSSRRPGSDPAFPTNVPPPPPAGHPVVAYPVPVHHWTQGAPPPPGPTHFPISVPGGYVFSNQPPPPLVTNGDAATIAYVTAISSGQPIYAIPGVPLQSIHQPITGTSGYHQVEPMDLTVPVVAQQSVTVPHFVHQPDGIVFSPSAHSHHDVPVIPPVTNPVHHTSGHTSHNLTNVQAASVYDNHHHINHVSLPELHKGHIPQEVNPPPSLPDTSTHPVGTSEVDKHLVTNSRVPPPSQTRHQVSNDPSLTPGVEFVGPILYGLDNAGTAAANGPSVIKNDAPSAIAKLNSSDNPESSSSSAHKSSADIKSTQASSLQHEETKSVQAISSEPAVPSGASSQSPVNQVSITNSKNSEVKQPSVFTPAPHTTPQTQPPKMWSSLFGKSKSSNPVSPTSPNLEVPTTPALPNVAVVEEVKSVRYWQQKEKEEAKLNLAAEQKVVPVGVQSDPIAPKILELLSALPVVHTPIVIQPRGLVNGNNVCFMNATLQVLMGCPPFVNMFRAFKNLPKRQGNGSCTPIFDSLNEFVNSFHNGQRVKSQGSRNKKGAHLDISVGQPFSPTSLLNVAQDILGLRIGIQHDAEEFLSKILMICHEEMENVMKLNQSYSFDNNNGKTATNNGHAYGSPVDVDIDEDDDESWQRVGPKNHHVETNVNDCGQTPLSSIFSGLSRSCLTRETGKNSDTLDSFFSLKLDIQGENVHSVADALQRLNVLETLHDIDGGKIQGQRRMFFDVLPPVLIMHLKLFQYSDGNGKKIQKKINFDVDLTIPKETLSKVGKTKYMSAKSRSYKLFGVVNHHGLKMTDGHYTSDVFLPVASGWLRFDDSEVIAIHEKQVLQHSDRHMPYLLFYRRMDVS
ncbi:ubiquitin carboxyl-terminal hydrolase 10 [Plakobranchus ocellatus]|uniref:ubiquitinyl hydrolase 1 n=1 Tax=Plakobranchus ocellatus TaxID=259542 RepID=A0AAV3Y489_9GAST|nr:ubiquitin carboxyl-terminal hydrolase 10 [Plakobranchus ocellatus]